MRKALKLKSRMRIVDGVMTATCKLFDGAEFKIYPPEHFWGINEEFLASREVVDGWVEVILEGQQGNACYISLPAASEIHGENVTVHEFELLPMNSTLEDYGAQEQVEAKPSSQESE